ncbi:MAG: OsmC family protein [Desulfobulbus sp.]|nr:OsmC family protein [Desulfobulbus sp.]
MAKLKTVRIEASADEKFKVAVTTGDRTFFVDQQIKVGGTDAGASPIDHLFASLAGCIATTARIMATQKQIILNGMDIKVEGSLDTHVIYGKSTEGRPGVTGIQVSVGLDSSMSDIEQRDFLEELRSRCPVWDTISGATPITLTTQ